MKQHRKVQKGAENLICSKEKIPFLKHSLCGTRVWVLTVENASSVAVHSQEILKVIIYEFSHHVSTWARTFCSIWFIFSFVKWDHYLYSLYCLQSLKLRKSPLLISVFNYYWSYTALVQSQADCPEVRGAWTKSQEMETSLLIWLDSVTPFWVSNMAFVLDSCGNITII